MGLFQCSSTDILMNEGCMWERKEPGISVKRVLPQEAGCDDWLWWAVWDMVSGWEEDRECSLWTYCLWGGLRGNCPVLLEPRRERGGGYKHWFGNHMCINNYCSLGEGMIILGRYVDTDKKDSLSQAYHEMVRTLTMVIIITTDEALHRMPGRFCAKYFKCVIVCIIRKTPLEYIINPVYWWGNWGLVEGRAGIWTQVWSISKSTFTTIIPQM